MASSSTAQRLATSVGQPLACASKESRIVAKLSCTPETLEFGAVSAAGCFERVDDRAGVPKGELPILDAAIAYFNENQRRRQYVVKSCTEVFSGKCTVKEGEITRAEVDPLLRASDLRISRSAVKINGLEITPRSGATIAVFPQIGRVVSSNAVVKFGDTTVPLPDAPRVNLDVDGSGTINGNIFGSGGAHHDRVLQAEHPVHRLRGLQHRRRGQTRSRRRRGQEVQRGDLPAGAAERLRRVRREAPERRRQGAGRQPERGRR